MSTLCVLGRQPALGLAELESLYGAENIRRVRDDIALVEADVAIVRLGGTIKTARLLTEMESTILAKIVTYCKKALPEHVQDIPEGKIKFGLGFYGLETNLRVINAVGLELKKIIKQTGRSVRVVPNVEPTLSSAQTLHNQLTSPVGLELLFVRDGNKTLIAQVDGVQNIESYAVRDRGRPNRDARVGMLPPKLAQIIINLAAADTDPIDKRLLDPFCGTGVVLQEAALMGFGVYATDIEDRMVRFTRDNLVWLFDTHNIHIGRYFEVADATSHTWQQPVDIVACEGYLGVPFTHEPDREVLEETINTCNLIMRKFLSNLYPQLAPGTRICIAAPAWYSRSTIRHLKVIEDISNTGYERISFEHAPSGALIYHREGQIVGRELVVLKKQS